MPLVTFLAYVIRLHPFYTLKYNQIEHMRNEYNQVEHMRNDMKYNLWLTFHFIYQKIFILPTF